MIPTWLTIELAMIPVVIAGLGGLVWLIRLEGVVTFNKSILDEKYKNLLEKYKNLKEKLDSHSTESDSYRENQIRMEETVCFYERRFRRN